MSPALVRFRENVKLNKQKSAIKFVNASSEDEASKLPSSEMSDSSALAIDSKSQKKQKKSKKKKLDVDVCEVTDEIEPETIKKKKHKKSKKADTIYENTHADSETFNSVVAEETIVRKSKSKSKLRIAEDCSSTLVPDDGAVKSSKKRKKKSDRPENVQENLSTIESNVDDSHPEKFKRKKKSKKRAQNKLEACDLDMAAKTVKQKDEPEIVVAQVDAAGESRDHLSTMKETKKKHKKKKTRSDDQVKQSDEMETARKSKKAKKDKYKSVEHITEPTIAENNKTYNVAKTQKKKRVRADDDAGQSSDGATSKKKRKKSKSKDIETPKKSSEPDVREIQAEESVQSEAKNGDGQWDAVSLGTDTRTNKFLRLMGAQKSSSKVTSLKSGTTHSSRAMSAQQEQQLNSQLEEQFVKAKQSIILKGKGVGLGFEKQPGEGKKFYIDVSQSKSKKFDDD